MPVEIFHAKKFVCENAPKYCTSQNSMDAFTKKISVAAKHSQVLNSRTYLRKANYAKFDFLISQKIHAYRIILVQNLCLLQEIAPLLK